MLVFYGQYEKNREVKRRGKKNHPVFYYQRKLLLTFCPIEGF